MIRKKYQQEETLVIITCENEKYYRLIIEEIDLNRKYLKEYIEKKFDEAINKHKAEGNIYLVDSIRKALAQYKYERAY